MRATDVLCAQLDCGSAVAVVEADWFGEMSGLMCLIVRGRRHTYHDVASHHGVKLQFSAALGNSSTSPAQVFSTPYTAPSGWLVLGETVQEGWRFSTAARGGHCLMTRCSGAPPAPEEAGSIR
ncbi:hypothetical protein QTP86_013144 [Hemibagrus guttatus]|nr:hypothetical protein QTP86_013144 [Hemibagrus guttatus]